MGPRRGAVKVKRLGDRARTRARPAASMATRRSGSAMALQALFIGARDGRLRC
jgi:hypothetical protein